MKNWKKKTPGLILERLRSLYEFLEKVKNTSQYQTYTTLVENSSLTTNEISILLTHGILQKIPVNGGANRYIWNSIPPNIHMAERLISVSKVKPGGKVESFKEFNKPEEDKKVVVVKKEKEKEEKITHTTALSYIESENHFHITISKEALAQDFIDIENFFSYLKYKKRK